MKKIMLVAVCAAFYFSCQDKKQEETTVPNSTSTHINLVIPQSNGYDISFCWNGKEYDLVADLSFWKQTLPHETFLNNVSQEYASEVVIGEGQKIGFDNCTFIIESVDKKRVKQIKVVVDE